MATNRAVEWANRFLDDAKERQVNTIIADGIIGISMSHELSGLVGIANTYVRALKADGFEEVPPDHAARARFEAYRVNAIDSNGALKGNSAAFGMLETLAAYALERLAAASPRKIIHQRIVSMSSRIRLIVAPLEQAHPGVDWSGTRDANAPRPDFDLAPEDRATIVKAWELSDSTVAAQTTIGLDGDLVTRMDKRFVGNATVRSIHDESVRTAIGTWDVIVKGIMQLARAALD